MLFVNAMYIFRSTCNRPSQKTIKVLYPFTNESQRRPLLDGSFFSSNFTQGIKLSIKWNNVLIELYFRSKDKELFIIN